MKFKEEGSLPPGGSNFIIRKYQRDIVSLFNTTPRKRKSLKHILEEQDYTIELKDGTIHKLDKNEVIYAAENIPWYLHPRTLIPIVIEYAAVGDKRVFRVMGDKWDRRIVEVLLKGEFGVEGERILEYNEVAKLISLYKSLFTIILSL
ncbi:MAG: DUF61 family protein [Desulfurococcales archaeon]|nr:DUF61 family protein [Desulfurococcales archaeon]